jgi:hypothetical protein
VLDLYNVSQSGVHHGLFVRVYALE